MSELLDCPFCGNNGAWSSYDKNNDYSECADGWYTHCGNCSAQVGPFGHEEESEKAWNERNED